MSYKWQAFDRNFSNEEEYVLTYDDGRHAQSYLEHIKILQFTSLCYKYFILELEENF